MAAFLAPPALPLKAGYARIDSPRVASSPRRRPATSVSMLADTHSEKAPSSLDELVRNWFVSKTSRKPSESSGRERTELMSSAISGPMSGPEDIHFLLSTTIVAKQEAAATMSRLLKDLSEYAELHSEENGVLQFAANQSPEDPTCFMVMERFVNRASMITYQKSSAYQQFIREAQPLLEKPFGLHLCKERAGKVSSGYYPFGPAGEGGRDDMILR
jgi:quinol monooxygenase YgiN